LPSLGDNDRLEVGVIRVEVQQLRERAKHYRSVAESASGADKRDLLRIAHDFEEEAARIAVATLQAA
jgi:hypothetical protein